MEGELFVELGKGEVAQPPHHVDFTFLFPSSLPIPLPQHFSSHVNVLPFISPFRDYCGFQSHVSKLFHQLHQQFFVLFTSPPTGRSGYFTSLIIFPFSFYISSQHKVAVLGLKSINLSPQFHRQLTFSLMVIPLYLLISFF